MSTSKPRPRQTGRIHRIAALGYHPDGKPVSSSRAIRKVQDSQGNSISAPRRTKWNGTTNNDLLNMTSKKGKKRALEVEDDEIMEAGPYTSPRSSRHTDRASTRSTRSTSKKKRQFMDCVLLPSRSKALPSTSNQPSDSAEAQSLPDSEFLKLIHHSASVFYGSRGQLRDRSELLSEVLHAGDALREAKREAEKGQAPMPSRKRSERAAKMKTMHAAFGGDVLVALGILLEEDIIHHLQPTALPDGWDDMEIVGDEAYPLHVPSVNVESSEEGAEEMVEGNTETPRQTRAMTRKNGGR
ncbi:hypothetical protein FRB90_004936 [Tulasnella sp. 427]|nr:hypothetical protein FRB90_004936 [Tulasnella sp. 427]